MNRQPNDGDAVGRPFKRRALSIAGMSLAAVLLVGGTYAYFTRESSASAQVELSSTKVEIINSWNEKNGLGLNEAGLLPGDRVNDTVVARNVGDDCFLRIRLRITKGDDGASTSTARFDPTTLSTLASPAIDDLNNIVGTLYYDSNFKISAAGQSGGLQPTAFTPTYGNENAANVLSTNASTYTRSYLTSQYGYVSNVLSSYATTRSAARSATPYNTRLGAFRNVTTQSEYEHGLFTFEYVGSASGAGNGGKLDSAALTNTPLVTTVCVPYDYTNAPTGGTNADGTDSGYTLSFWAESVPAGDFDGLEGNLEAKRVAAMDRLDGIYPATNYYPQGS